MEALGLMPSETGKPKGRKTGQNMNDYPLKGGLFLDECKNLVVNKAFKIPWFDRWSDPFNDVETDPEILEYLETSLTSELEENTEKDIASLLSTPIVKLMPSLSLDILISPTARVTPSKTHYQCTSCQSNVWGKKGLEMLCIPCNEIFFPTD